MPTYTNVSEASQVTTEILDAAEMIYDGWYAERGIDWNEFIDRLDGSPLENGTSLDLGEDMLSPAITKIRKHIRKHIRKYAAESL